MSFDLFQARADLQAGWQTLHDVNKAELISNILGAGMSGRTLAKSLGKSEGLIRHLAIANDASATDKKLALNGELSTAELVRRVRDRRDRDQQQALELAATRNVKTIAQATDEIVTWLLERLGGPYAEQVVEEARFLSANAEATGKFPKGKAPAGMSFAEIMNRCLQSTKPSHDVDQSSRYAYCLAVGCYYAFPDSNVRSRVLDHALTRVIRGR
jgi:hypothetical protein